MTRQTRRAYTACRGTRKRIALKAGMKLTRSNADIYSGGELQKKAWISVSDGYIYVSRDTGRSYWLLHRIEPSKRPVIAFNDDARSFRIGGTRVVIHGCTDYERVKAMLAPYSRA